MKKLLVFIMAAMLAMGASAARYDADGARVFDYWGLTTTGKYSVCRAANTDCLPLTTYIPSGKTVVATEIVPLSGHMVLVVYWK